MMQHCKHEAYCQHKDWTANDDLTRTTRNWVMGFASRLKPRRFEQSAYAPPVVNVQQPPAQVGALNPGETAYREMSTRADIWPQLTMAIVLASLGTACVVCGYCAVVFVPKRPVFVFASLMSLISLVVFARLNWDILVRGDDGRLITRKRDAETQPTTDPQVLKVKGELHEGRRTIYDELDITDYPAWHRFCQAVDGGRNFSETEAKRHKVPQNDWDTVYNKWVRRGWLVPAKRRGTPTLQAVGRHWVKLYATTPPAADTSGAGEG